MLYRLKYQKVRHGYVETLTLPAVFSKEHLALQCNLICVLCEESGATHNLIIEKYFGKSESWRKIPMPIDIQEKIL